MVRVFNAYFPGRTLVLSVSEIVLVCLAFVAPMLVVYGRDTSLVLQYEGGFMKVAVAALVFFGCMYYLDMYDSVVLNNRREVFTRLVQVGGASCIVLAVVYYALPDTRIALGIFIAGVFLVFIFLASWRVFFSGICRALNLVQRTLVLGEGPLAYELADEVHKRPETGIDLIGYVNVTGVPNGNGTVRFMGGLDNLTDIVREQRIERIVIAMADRRGTLPLASLLALKTEGVQVQDAADVYEALTGKVPLESLKLSWLLFSSGFRVSPVLLIYKRLFAALGSLLLLVITSPVLLLIVIAIRLDSRGPAMFRQNRVGQKGKTFTLYKFRTMFVDCDADGNHRPAEHGDARITRVGRFLRRSRLDELPQLFNILLGDMYFVGPRPFVPDQEAECQQHIPLYSQRWSVKPGATGWAQIHRGYCATIADNTEKLAYDLFYIKNMSIGLDLLIVFSTLKTLLLSRGGR